MSLTKITVCFHMYRFNFKVILYFGCFILITSRCGPTSSSMRSHHRYYLTWPILHVGTRCLMGTSALLDWGLYRYTTNIGAASWQNQQNGMCTKRRLRSAWPSAQLPIKRTAKTLIRLGKSPGWSESSLGACAILLVLSGCSSFVQFMNSSQPYLNTEMVVSCMLNLQTHYNLS